MSYDKLAMACSGCKHCYYTASNGTHPSRIPESYAPELREKLMKPHVRCLFFKDYIAAVGERVTGCDGHKSYRLTRFIIPDGCPTQAAIRKETAQGYLFDERKPTNRKNQNTRPGVACEAHLF